MRRQFDDLQLGSLELFCLAAESGGFSAAALAAGVTPAAVSRAVARLEERLGIRLFVRTTRSIRLTEGGRGYYEQCRQALGQLVEAEREAMGQQLQPSGTLRISMPVSYGHLRILPLLPAFRQRYPQVQVDVHLSNRNIDFVGEGYDAAIRVRALPDSSLVARPLEDARLALVAAPDYLARQGTPQSLEDLQRHECIQFLLPSSGRAISWLFRVDGADQEVFTQGNYSCSDDLYGGVVLAKQGAGLIQTYRYLFERELAEGSLVEVLPQFAGCSRPHSLLYPSGRHVPLRLRAFVDFLMEQRKHWPR
ncbi:LysR family transcriptional regulator [Pseudomonas knackmussii B13]|uniref:LysR family transcriptional regulator n=1 Tax=Pseudomonas knackmussii (strain DSM 6978 / CCUG 54928 / LMG 23759 / B13) TaxID=1301098 RepID=A0A024HH31_PSEKB|nr:LysR family transcriptional regulator [Pseudomonas knackmussii]CDF84176.1 LysR family transcriptional regulator [Pseudomonas knackmussii B13]